MAEKSTVLATALATQCEDRKIMLVAAESCTGGTLCQVLSSVPCSSWFLGGIISYSNELKSALLHVPKAMIDQCGAVSKEVVEAMAVGAIKITSADISISISGLAGPTSGDEDKPVGTVWFGLADRKRNTVISTKQFFSGERNQVRDASTEFAMQWIIEHINTKR
jgi:nicotinamide-nucleotide amidase